jgi:hypothetical protein
VSGAVNRHWLDMYGKLSQRDDYDNAPLINDKLNGDKYVMEYIQK